MQCEGGAPGSVPEPRKKKEVMQIGAIEMAECGGKVELYSCLSYAMDFT
jgi:hypothetical protein